MVAAVVLLLVSGGLGLALSLKEEEMVVQGVFLLLFVNWLLGNQFSSRLERRRTGCPVGNCCFSSSQ